MKLNTNHMLCTINVPSQFEEFRRMYCFLFSLSVLDILCNFWNYYMEYWSMEHALYTNVTQTLSICLCDTPFSTIYFLLIVCSVLCLVQLTKWWCTVHFTLIIMWKYPYWIPLININALHICGWTPRERELCLRLLLLFLVLFGGFLPRDWFPRSVLI